jgi:hypothetical protein
MLRHIQKSFIFLSLLHHRSMHYLHHSEISSFQKAFIYSCSVNSLRIYGYLDPSVQLHIFGIILFIIVA